MGGERRQGRSWTFANCSFDENQWSLSVDGKRVALEAKPLELLHELLLNAGKVVTKDELLDRIWPDVIVVEASLPTAVRKLRLALGDDRSGRTIVETVAGIGYRLAVEVEVERRSTGASLPTAVGHERRASVAAVGGSGLGFRRLASVAAGVALLVVALAIGFGASQNVVANPPAKSVDRIAAISALRHLDIPRVERMLVQGWNPNMSFDDQGNTPLTYVLEICEWDPGHDRRQLMMMVKTLIENGAYFDRPNFWGDTAYSIAKAPRYCGPNHPATLLIRSKCYDGLGAPADRCLATYELARRRRKGAPAEQGG
jgi:DNA-binding winged helix-turn-helix (wHTH) protein